MWKPRLKGNSAERKTQGEQGGTEDSSRTMQERRLKGSNADTRTHAEQCETKTQDNVETNAEEEQF